MRAGPSSFREFTVPLRVAYFVHSTLGLDSQRDPAADHGETQVRVTEPPAPRSPG